MGSTAAFLPCPGAAMSRAALRDAAGPARGEVSAAAATFESHLSAQTRAWTRSRWDPSLGGKKVASIGAGTVISGNSGAPVLLDLPKPFPILWLVSPMSITSLNANVLILNWFLKGFCMGGPSPPPFPPLLAILSHTPISAHTLNSGLYRKYD